MSRAHHDRLKSLFITTWMMALVGVAAHAGVVLYREGFWLGWASALVAVTGFLGFFGFLFLRLTPRTAKAPPIPFAFALAGAAGALVAVWRDGYVTWLPLGYAAIVALGGGAAYVFWYSRLDRSAGRLRPGDRLPDLVFDGLDGSEAFSSDFLGNSAVFLFFRGNWCPLCMAQIREIAASYRELAERGVRVVLVSPQPEENTRALAARFDVPFVYLVDRDLRAARQLGIVHLSGVPTGIEMLGYDSDTVLPTAIVVDEEGTILLADQTDNYRVRPEPSTFLAALAARPTPEPETTSSVERDEKPPTAQPAGL